MNELIEPAANMQYDRIKLATIHQSSAPNEALLLHLAIKRSKTATVARIPHATVTRITLSRCGLTVSMLLSKIKLFLVWTLIHLLLKHCGRKTEDRVKLEVDTRSQKK